MTRAPCPGDVFDVPIAALRGPVGRDDLARVLAAAEGTPSAANLQPWMFYVLLSEVARGTVAEHALNALGLKLPNHRADALAAAPALVLVCADRLRARCRFGDVGERLFGIQDVAVAAAAVRARAWREGLASCWVRELDFDAVGRGLGLTPRFAAQALLAFGRAEATDLERPPSLPPDIYVRWDDGAEQEGA